VKFEPLDIATLEKDELLEAMDLILKDTGGIDVVC
jgi:hypothetical protein